MPILSASLSRNLLPVLLAACWAGSLPAHADPDGDRARRLREAGAILPLEKILSQARHHQPGEILEVELDQSKDGGYIYEMEILDAHGQVWELELDASSGALLKREADD